MQNKSSSKYLEGEWLWNGKYRYIHMAASRIVETKNIIIAYIMDDGRVHEYAINASSSESSQQCNEEIAILCHKRHIYNLHLPYAAAADV